MAKDYAAMARADIKARKCSNRTSFISMGDGGYMAVECEPALWVVVVKDLVTGKRERHPLCNHCARVDFMDDDCPGSDDPDGESEFLALEFLPPKQDPRRTRVIEPADTDAKCRGMQYNTTDGTCRDGQLVYVTVTTHPNESVPAVGKIGGANWCEECLKDVTRPVVNDPVRWVVHPDAPKQLKNLAR